MVKTGSFLFSLFLILFSGNLQARMTVRSELSADKVEKGSPFYLQITLVSDESMPKVSQLQVPSDNSALEYMGKSENVSTSISIFNGKRNNRYTKTLRLQFAALEEGTHTIAPIDLGIKGLKKVGPFKVEVVKELKGSGAKNPSQRRSRGRRGSLFGILDQFLGDSNPLEMLDDSMVAKPDLFLEAVVDKTKIYKGEQIFVRWYVYTRGALTSFDTLSFPNLGGFWKENVDFANNFEWENTVHNGQAYKKAILSSYALTPFKTGELKLDSYQVRATVRGVPFGGSKVFKVKSKVIPIQVEELPEPQPAEFKGGVGNYSLDYLSDSNPGAQAQSRVGEIFKFKVKVVGNKASAKLVETPKLDLGEDFDLFSVSEKFNFYPKKMSSIKEFQFQIIPKKEGVYKLPDLKVAFALPYGQKTEDGEAYYARYLEFPSLKVLKGDPNVLVQDQDFSKEGKQESSTTKKFSSGPLQYLYSLDLPGVLAYLVLFVALLFSAFSFYQKYKDEGEKTPSFASHLQSSKGKVGQSLAKKRYKEAVLEALNLNFLMVGSLTGKRLATEEEFSKALEQLPSSLKSRKKDFASLNRSLQELAFSLDLESQGNQDRFMECFESQKQLLKEALNYIS